MLLNTIKSGFSFVKFAWCRHHHHPRHIQTHTKTREKTVTMLVKCFTTLVAVCSKSGKNYALRIQNMYFLRLMCCVWCYFLHTLLPQHNNTSIHFKPITLANELSSWEEKKPELCDKEASFFTFAYKFLCWRHNFVRSRLLLFGRLAFFSPFPSPVPFNSMVRSFLCNFMCMFSHICRLEIGENNSSCHANEHIIFGLVCRFFFFYFYSLCE